MICPSCGATNPPLQDVCHKCGKPLNPRGGSFFKKSGTPKTAPPTTFSKPKYEAYSRRGLFTHEEIARKMKMDYSYAHGDQTQKSLEGVLALVAQSVKPNLDMHAFLAGATTLIQRQFSLREVSIGLRDPDGLYRFKYLAGFSDDAAAAMKRLAYTRQQFDDNPDYKGTMISRYTKVFLAEDVPFREEEKATYSRPILLDASRHSPTESIEGDYVDFNIYGVDGELLGWIETSGTRMGTLPEIESIKWIELIAQVIGMAMLNQGHKQRISR